MTVGAIISTSKNMPKFIEIQNLGQDNIVQGIEKYLTDVGIGVSGLEGVADALDGGLVAVHLPVTSDEKLSAHLVKIFKVLA
jgi:hypothetical protein